MFLFLMTVKRIMMEKNRKKSFLYTIKQLQLLILRLFGNPTIEASVSRIFFYCFHRRRREWREMIANRIWFDLINVFAQIHITKKWDRENWAINRFSSKFPQSSGQSQTKQTQKFCMSMVWKILTDSIGKMACPRDSLAVRNELFRSIWAFSELFLVKVRYSHKIVSCDLIVWGGKNIHGWNEYNINK